MMNTILKNSYDIIPILDINQLLELNRQELILTNIIKCPYIILRDQIPDLLNKLNLNGIGIEIGVLVGEYSEVILSKSKLKKLYLCDAWKHIKDYNDSANVNDVEQEIRLKETLTRLSKFKDRIEILRMLSNEAVKKFDDNSLDFVYIDANHTYKYVLEDITIWYPKVRVGGIISGHDFIDDENLEFGVRSAVIKFFDNFQEVYITEDAWPSWFVIKK